MHACSEIDTFGKSFNLHGFEIFKDLSADECSEISALMRLRRYSPDSYVLSSEQNNRDVFFILSGQIRSCAISRNGKQIYFEDLYSGSMFGEFSAIDHNGRSADCLAVKESLLASISGPCFIDCMDKYPQVKDAVLRRVVKVVRNQMQRVSENVFSSVGQRVRLELIRLCAEAGSCSNTVRFDSVPTHNELALRIGTHREAVTRELNSLQSRGLITWNREIHMINNVSALAEYAEK